MRELYRKKNQRTKAREKGRIVQMEKMGRHGTGDRGVQSV